MTDQDIAGTRTDDEVRAGCARHLHHHGYRDPGEQLAEAARLTAELSTDRYGAGGVVAACEAEVAELLGKPAAAFLPSGTMAQQIALRVHADRRGRRTVAWHPRCHLEIGEAGAYHRLHGLVGRPVGDGNRLLTLADLEQVAEPLAALLVELPQREIGGRLPAWGELGAQVEWARSRGAAVHLDGARLWEASAGYQRSPAEIAALFDTVYVSFYKGLGGLAGCCLAGPTDVVAEAREWRTRHGGTLFALWPYAASALAGLRGRLPLMPRYLAHARDIAAALRDLPDVEVVPDPPDTAMMHIYLRTTAERFRAAARRLADERSTWTWSRSFDTERPGWQRVELAVGDATLAFDAAEAAALVADLAGEPG